MARIFNYLITRHQAAISIPINSGLVPLLHPFSIHQPKPPHPPPLIHHLISVIINHLSSTVVYCNKYNLISSGFTCV